MYGAVDCNGCHDISKPHSIVGVSRKCVGCHGDGYADILTVQKADVDEQLKVVLTAIDKLEKQVERSRSVGKGLAEVKSLVVSAKERAEFVGKVKGIHNPALAGEVLKQAERKLERARNLLRSL
jgi:hypothetical protein